ncbi:MAG: molybdopterin-dependent oxidoreductase [Desulfocapsa sp.]|uniref:Molybdopterin-dependent oxidoreductase n=1 Tax=Desulfotalea psychrophila TaxID=84980 RepID=A0ABS3AUG5_9BACT|nr:molybdopterin-dependent oxidoreductase [Desulfocapsa sp.]MBN4059960.1 molybdopterin-dependent oxidoreductase [Desulfotalea psychrophila]MBN4068408.1 molybdopterin-dependent oxidoreductase [Desulfotalea psychrophila]
MTDSTNTKKNSHKLNRRDFLQASSATLVAANLVTPATLSAQTRNDIPQHHLDTAACQLDPNVKIVHSVCLGCNARCGNRQIVRNNRLEKISGNPFHPYNSMGTPVDYATPVRDTLKMSSPVCGKAHDAVNYVYNERRLLRPLKRAGARGEGKFEPISWEQLITEVAQGGKLFAHLGENRNVPGLNACLSDLPIDNNDPGLGSRRNSFVYMTGRLQSGRKEFIDRFVKSAVGSINRIGHTDICGLGFRMGNYTMTEGKQVELKADPWGAEYILVFGANIYEALQPGLNTYGAAMAKRSSEKKVKFTIVDPRAQNGSVHAEEWIAILPGQDGAFAMGMIRWMLENNGCNTAFLQLSNHQAALDKGHSCYSNASHLVIDDSNHPDHGKFLRLYHLQQTSAEQDTNSYMITSAGEIVPFTTTSTGQLDATLTVTDKNGNPLTVTTSFALMKKGVLAHSLVDYAEMAGVPLEQLTRTAREFSAHGQKAAVCQYHGAGNYCNGTYAAYAVAMLSTLVGSIGLKGGYLTSGGASAPWKKGHYDLKKFPGQKKPQGVKISREGGKYESTTEFSRKKQGGGTGYPAKRPWFPFTKGGLSVETLSGIDAQYPYGCQVLFTYFYNPIYSTPGGYRFTETLADSDSVPLHVSIDVGINESNIYADYIVPDVTYLEGQYGWLTPHAPALKFTGVRAPCLEPLTEKTKDNRPYCMETFLIDLALTLDLPGFGKKVIPAKDGSMLPLFKAEDFYLRAYANIAANAKVPQGDTYDVSFVENNYPLAAFRSLLSAQEWQQLCYMLARGGVFTPYETVFSGERFLHGISRVVLYNETLASTRNSLSGERFSGTLIYQPPQDAAGQTLAEVDKEYPFTIITYKMNVHTQSRTNCHKYAMEIFPENFIQVNSSDAVAFGFQSGDTVRLVSASNSEGIIGKVVLSELVRPGCVALSFHYGHSQSGASTVTVARAKEVFLGGDKVADKGFLYGDPALGSGTNPNMVSRLDPHLDNTPLIDTLAGIPDFSSTRVKLIKTDQS